MGLDGREADDAATPSASADERNGMAEGVQQIAVVALHVDGALLGRCLHECLAVNATDHVHEDIETGETGRDGGIEPCECRGLRGIEHLGEHGAAEGREPVARPLGGCRVVIAESHIDPSAAEGVANSRPDPRGATDNHRYFAGKSGPCIESTHRALPARRAQTRRAPRDRRLTRPALGT
jgi:hypothetical protein